MSQTAGRSPSQPRPLAVLFGWAVSLTLSGVILLQSQQPTRVTPLVLQWAPFLRDVLPATFEFYARKTLHVLGYAALAASWARTLHLTFPGRPRLILAAVPIALFLAVCDEALQSTTDFRTGRTEDVWLDFAGILIGYAAAVRWGSGRRRGKSKTDTSANP